VKESTIVGKEWKISSKIRTEIVEVNGSVEKSAGSVQDFFNPLKDRKSSCRDNVIVGDIVACPNEIEMVKGSSGFFWVVQSTRSSLLN